MGYQDEHGKNHPLDRDGLPVLGTPLPSALHIYTCFDRSNCYSTPQTTLLNTPVVIYKATDDVYAFGVHLLKLIVRVSGEVHELVLAVRKVL